ncbi:MAG: YbfB/YjiJ family MFS transporter [Beijerinckiaceae bacterium]
MKQPLLPFALAPALPLALGGLLTFAVAMGIGRFVYTPILPMMMRELGLSSSAAGLIASVNFIGYLIGALMAAAPALPGTQRSGLLAALVISTITTAEMALTPDPYIFAALRFFSGIASAFAMVLSTSLVLDRLRAAGAAHLSWLHFAGIGFGIALSAIAVFVASENGGGWKSAWIVSGILSAIGTGCVFLLVPDEASARADFPARSSYAKGFWPLAFAYGLFGFGYVITATFIVAQARTEQSAALECTIWVIVGLGAMPSVAMWAALAGRLGLTRAFGIACCVEALGVSASVLGSGRGGLLFAAALFGATFMGIVSLGVMAARQMAIGNARRAVAVMTAAFSIGQIIGPSFAGFLADQSGGFLWPVLSASAALLAASGISLSLRPAKA